MADPDIDEDEIDPILQALMDGAEAHGDESGSEAEAGDLLAFLNAAWYALDDDGKARFWASAAVRETVGLDEEEPTDDYAELRALLAGGKEDAARPDDPPPVYPEHLESECCGQPSEPECAWVEAGCGYTCQVCQLHVSAVRRDDGGTIVDHDKHYPAIRGYYAALDAWEERNGDKDPG